MRGESIRFGRFCFPGIAFWMVLSSAGWSWASMSGQAVKSATSAAANASIVDPDDPDEHGRVVGELLRREQFAALDAMVAAERLNKTRFPGGGWKLATAYIMLSRPSLRPDREIPDADWQAHFKRLQRWIAARPDSITPRVALADAYTNYAWVARGEEFAHLVKDRQWQLFDRRLQMARDILEKAATLSEKCPEWYEVMQSVAQGQSWDLAEQEKLLDRAVQFEPLYYYFYQHHAQNLQPKWFGEPGDAEKFAGRIASRIGGKQGAIIYFEVASRLFACGCEEDGIDFRLMSWDRIKEGYAAEVELYGTSNVKLNNFASLAVTADDQPLAKTLFLRIGENWTKTAWGSKDYFEESRAWALAAPAQ